MTVQGSAAANGGHPSLPHPPVYSFVTTEDEQVNFLLVKQSVLAGLQVAV
jgi:hypothetical protein